MKRSIGQAKDISIRIVMLITLCVTFCGIFIVVNAQYRFPRPEFQNQYTQPQETFPRGRHTAFEYIDIFLLFLALCIAAYIVIIKRSRKGVFLLMITCLLYFGFYRKGCICPIGSIQNLSLALGDSTYLVSVSTVLFFVLPLIFSLFFGRVFCSSVCPLGGIQDIVIVKSFNLPNWLNTILAFVPYIYLGLAVLFAYTGAGFIICQLDPFVGIFRRSASVSMIFWGIVLLSVGIVFARPYCRFLCPYSILLGWMSIFSKWHASITPNQCIRCRLCEKSCPVDAIQVPETQTSMEPRSQSLRRFISICLLLPVWITVGFFVGQQASGWLSLMHPKVRLAEQMLREDNIRTDNTTEESRTFRTGSFPLSELISQAQHIRKRFHKGSGFLGIFLGMVFGCSLIRYSMVRRHSYYTPVRRRCISCSRCFRVCPQEQLRLKKGDIKEEIHEA